MADFHKLTVKNIIRETPKAVSIEFDIPSDLKETYFFVPGQYITIKASPKGDEIRRAYSICSTPGQEGLKVAVKEVENGTFSVFANTELKIGDVLDVHPPEGNFLLQIDSNAQNTYAAFAAGSGITPIMGMIKSVLQEETESKFVLVYGNQTPSETIFLNELTALQNQYPERLFIEYFYSRTQTEGARFGRIEKSIVNYIVKNKFEDIRFSDFYLCGPEEMINDVKETLLENGIDQNIIHFELFTSSSEEVVLDINLEGKTNVTIIVDEEEFNFVMDQKKTLLDAALDQDIDAPYSCQGGVCSSCICRISEGNAVMEKNSILTDSEIEEGLVLACQAHPTTSNVKVDFDDV